MEKGKIYNGTSSLGHLYSVDTKFGPKGMLRDNLCVCFRRDTSVQKDALSQGPETRY